MCLTQETVQIGKVELSLADIVNVIVSVVVVSVVIVFVGVVNDNVIFFFSVVLLDQAFSRLVVNVGGGKAV